MIVTQIVRRFGRVGGMERYVWELVRELLNRNVRIRIICQDYIDELPGLNPEDIFFVGASAPRPRWRAMWTFRQSVSRLVSQSNTDFGIIHSHERSLVHQVTTIHGPLVGPLSHMNLLSVLSRRMRRWSLMENEEVCSERVQAVCSVSNASLRQLSAFYPAASLVHEPVWPGINLRSSHDMTVNRGRILFVGTEWKRKGLELAVRIIARARRISGLNLTLTIIGPDFREIPSWISRLIWVTPRGPADPDYENHDVLIHPAKIEPFGMVVSEARRDGLSCLISDRVGAADLEFQQTLRYRLDDSIDEWADGLIQLCGLITRTTEVRWTWGDLAERYLGIYEGLDV